MHGRTPRRTDAASSRRAIEEILKHTLRDDSGIILRGPAALIFMAVMFALAIFGLISWESFATLAIVAVVLTVGGMIVSTLSSSSNKARTPVTHTPQEAPVRCPGCGAAWYLDANERRLGYTCEDCGAVVWRGTSSPVQAPSIMLDAPGVQTQAALICRTCGTEVVDGDTYCRACGNRINDTPGACSCGAETREDDNFCHACGATVARS